MPLPSLDDHRELGRVGSQRDTLFFQTGAELQGDLVVPGLGDSPTAHVASAIGQALDLKLLPLAGTDGDFFAHTVFQCHWSTVGNIDSTGTLDGEAVSGFIPPMPDLNRLFAAIGNSVAERDARHRALGTEPSFHQVGPAEGYRLLGREQFQFQRRIRHAC